MSESGFWRELSAEHRRDLAEFGLETMKRHQALRYFTWRWRASQILRSAQLRFLLRHSSPAAWARAWRQPELSDQAWAGAEWPVGERRLYTFATRLLWEFAEAEGDPRVMALEEPLLGSPLPVHHKGRLISQDLANTALEVRAMRVGVPRSFLEVGAGYGRTAYALLSLYPRSTYTIVDIEPALSIARWYLGQLFAADRLRFLSPGEVGQIGNNSVDVALTISSLHEMTPATVAGYLALFDRVARRVYAKQWTSWHNPVDDITMTFAEYPFPSHWRRLHWATAPVQTRFTQALWVTRSSAP